ncbi:MAG: hypothetical protein PHN72_04315 [Bacilli bacterium]|nr:hypothetical protein [Bacilli bacterium]
MKENSIIKKEITELEEALYSYITMRYPHINTDTEEVQQFIKYELVQKYKREYTLSESAITDMLRNGKLQGYIETLMDKKNFKKRKYPYQIKENFEKKMAIQYYDEEGKFVTGTRNTIMYFPVPKSFANAVVSERHEINGNICHFRTTYAADKFASNQDKEKYAVEEICFSTVKRLWFKSMQYHGMFDTKDISSRTTNEKQYILIPNQKKNMHL